MEGRFAVPFHFAVEFLVLVVAIGAALDALRARRHGAGWWSVGQGAGFLLLVASEAAHGSLAARADADQLVLGLRFASFVLLAVSARPAEHVLLLPIATASAPALFFPGPDRSLAIGPAAAALAVAGRAWRAHRTDQDPATFAFAAAFVSFASAEAATALAPATGGWVAAAHAARALGALFLARWLWSSVVRSVRMRFVAALVVVLAVTVIAVGGAVSLVMGDRIQGDQLQRLADLGGARVQSIFELGESAQNSAKLFADSTTVGDRLAGPADRASIEAELGGLIRLFDVDFIVATDARGLVRGAVESATPTHQQSRRIGGTRALAIAGLPAVKQAPTNAVQVLLGTQPVVLGSVPVERDGRKRGVVAVGYRIDGPYLKRVKTDTGGADATLVITPDTPVVTTLADADEAGRALSVLASVLRAAREDNVRVTRTLTVGDDRLATAFVPITKNRDSTQVVAMLALSLKGDVLADAQLGVSRTLFLLTLAAMLVAALLAWLSGGRVTRPIRSLTYVARELTAGNLQARTKVTSVDEVGALGSAFNEMAFELQRKTGDLHRSADAEATLRARLEAVLQSMGDGLIATDSEGRVVTFNRAAEEMFGRQGERALGRPIAELMHGRSGDGRALADVAMRGAAAEGTLEAGKERIPVALTAAPLLDADGVEIGRVVVIRDVSSEYQAERMKSEFLANVSHELRTPITPIKGFAEIMRRKRVPREKAVQFVDAILESVGRLERVADILVDFAALEAGRLKPRSEPVPVRGLLDGVAHRWRERDSLHRFVRRGGDQLPPVLGDQRLLERSLEELVDNAVKFSPKGGPIEIIAEPFANGAGTRAPSRVRITVRDHGIGIDPGRVGELFQDFRQLDGSETRAYGGLGLGLAYVKRIASVHGGEVLVESKPGRGSSFSLVLPVAVRRPVKAGVVRRRGRSR